MPLEPADFCDFHEVCYTSMFLMFSIFWIEVVPCKMKIFLVSFKHIYIYMYIWMCVYAYACMCMYACSFPIKVDQIDFRLKHMVIPQKNKVSVPWLK